MVWFLIFVFVGEEKGDVGLLVLFLFGCGDVFVDD